MKNILLLAMSTFGRDTREKDNFYQYQGGDVFIGRSQLEPITHMLSIERKKKGEKLDKIIILETEETVKSDDGKESAVDFYKMRVNDFIDKVEYIDIPINENEPAEGIREATSIIWKEYEEQKKKNDKIRLWVDTQGGFRDVVMVFNAIISLLREQGIEPEGIYSIRYTSKNTKENPCPIIDQTKNYDIFKFVSAMQEFMDFGKATGLKKYYGEKNGFVQAVNGIADAIQMCQSQKFEEAIQKFAKYLESKEYKKEDPYLQIFVEFIKNDYGILLEQPNNIIEQIRWCVRKEFYQQAITIYIEKIPKYYYDHKMVELNLTEVSNSGENCYAKAFYTNLFNEMLKNEEEILKYILKELCCELEENNEQNIKEYLKHQLIREDLSQNVKLAIKKIIEKLDNTYDSKGKRKKSENGVPKTVKKYINHIYNNKKEHNEFLYGNKFEEVQTNSKAKKIKAIKAAKEKEPDLAKKMEYYFAMKILRNWVNHASEGEIDEEDREAIAFLRSEQINIGIEEKPDGIKLDYQKIKEFIMDGLHLE